MIVAFVRFLVDSGLVGKEPPANDDQWLGDFIQVANCIAIAGRLGLEHGYVFERMSYGPCSDRMTDEIEAALPRVRAGLGGEAPPLPPGFAKDRFLRLLAGKDAKWIMAAVYLILKSHARPDVDWLVDWIGHLTAGQSPEYCRGIVREMTAPEIGIVLDCDKFSYDKPWQPEVASATHYVGDARPVPAAAV